MYQAPRRECDLSTDGNSSRVDARRRSSPSVHMRWLALVALAVVSVTTFTMNASPGGRARAEGGPPDHSQTALVSRPGHVHLALWDKVVFGRFVAIDGMIRRYSHRYGIDGFWTTLAFASESVLDPLAKGSLVDDRGIGQVGFQAERRGRQRGSNPSSPDYEASLDRHGSIWDPRTNIIFASILFRWVYTVPGVNSGAKAYAVYTDGYAGLNPDGTISEPASRDVARARSYARRITVFRQLVSLARTQDRDAWSATVPNRLTRGIMEIAATRPDGIRTYAALTRLYTKESRAIRHPWTVIRIAREAMNFTDLRVRVYGADGTASYRSLIRILAKRHALFDEGPAGLKLLYAGLLDDLEARTGS